MLPPMPPILVPISIQQPSAKPRPEITPVTPTHPATGESEVFLERRHPQEARGLLYEQLQKEADAQQQSGEHAADKDQKEAEKEKLTQTAEQESVLSVEEVDFSDQYAEDSDKERPGLLLDVRV